MHSILAYKNGSFRKIGDTEFGSIIRSAIVDFTNPSEVELNTFFDKIQLHIPDFYGDLDKIEVPSIVNKEEYLHVVFGSPLVSDKQTGTAPLTLLIYKGFLILVHPHPIKSITVLLDELQKENSRLNKQSVSAIVYHILSGVNDEMTELIDKIGDDIEVLEDKVVRSPKQEDVKKVYTFKKILLFFKSVLRHNSNVVSIILREDHIKAFIRDPKDFNNLYNDLNQNISVVEMYRERLGEVLDVYEGALANRLNEVMKYFAAGAALLLWPSVVSGIYGMNFKYMPLLDNPNGFYIMLSIMILGIGFLLLLFRSKKWL